MRDDKAQLDKFCERCRERIRKSYPEYEYIIGNIERAENKLYTTGVRSIQLLSFIIISDYLYQSYIRISVCTHRIINSVGCIAVDEKIDNVAVIVIYYLCYYHAVVRPAVNYILDNITGLCGKILPSVSATMPLPVFLLQYS